MGDLTNPRVIITKGFLFLLTGVAAATILILRHPHWQTAVLTGITVWCFCRFYYFTFYVIQHYVDDTYRFAGLWSFVCYLAQRRSTAGQRE